MNKKPIPPKLATSLLMRFLREDLAEEVAGDLEEKFYSTLKRQSATRAKLNYWYQVINYIRPFAFKKQKSPSNHYTMFQNYFKISWRNLYKQRMYSAVKIGGFAIGIAACFLITLFIQDELRYDLQYPDGNRIYRVVDGYNDDGEQHYGVWQTAPFANAIKEDFPEVEKSGRYLNSELFGAGSFEIRPADNPENTYEEGVTYFDQELLDILKLPMVYGSREHALKEPRTLVLTRKKAEKYFPNEDPVGKLMVINNNPEVYKIGGVIEDFPATSHIQFDFLMTMTGHENWPGEQTYWGATNYPTYILLREGADVKALEKKLLSVVNKYMLPLWIEQQRTNPKDIANKISFKLQPVKDIHLMSEGISDTVEHGDIRFIWLFGAIAGFILMIACINFINLSTARSANRAKEVGLRKTVGSFRSNIISQFLTESLLFSGLSFMLGIILAWLLLPYFNNLATKTLIFPWKEIWLFPIIIGSALVVGVLAGLYPSFYLSAFKPVDVLKGNLSRGSKSSTTRSSLVVFQFTTSIILIIATFIIYRQVNFILNTKIGYEKDQVIMIQGSNTLDKQVFPFKEELLKLSQVSSATISDYLPVRGTKRNGNGFWKEGKANDEQSVGVQIWRTDFDYIKTMGMKIVEGRDFDYKVASDSQAAIINQAMAKEMGLTDPIGKRVTNGGKRLWTVVGVVEDFHFESLREEIRPLCFVYGRSQNIVSVKVKSADMGATIKGIESVWKKFSPNQPLRYAFLNETYARMYSDVARMGYIFTTFAVLAIIVACLGLFALSAFMVEQRSKEISIRLVLGASMKSIFNLLTLNFLKLVLISILIAAPIAWYMMKSWLEDFTYRTDITWDVFVLAGFLAVIIALVTISYQSLRAALMNPVRSLKSE